MANHKVAADKEDFEQDLNELRENYSRVGCDDSESGK